MDGQLSLEDLWIRQKERTLGWLRLGFSIVAILVVQLDPDKISRYPLLYQFARYSFASYSLLVLFLAYRLESSASARLGVFTTCLDLLWVSLIDFAGGPGTPFFVYYLFPVITASSRYGIKGSLTVAFIGIAIYGTMRFSSFYDRPMELDTFVVRCVYLLALAYMFGYLSEFEKKQNRKLVALNKLVGEAAVAEERRRVAREMHDSLLQVLASLGLRLEACRRQLIGNPAALTQELELMETASKDSMAEIRSFLEGKAGYNLPPGTLVEKIEEEMKFLRDGIGLKMVFETEPEELNLPPVIEKELYFVLREGLLNVARHSHASEAELMIKATNGELRASLVDDGIGFDVEAARPGGGYGLTNMEERVKKLRGRFSVASIPGKGTKLSFVVPLRS